MQDLPISDRMFIPEEEARAGGQKVKIKGEKRTTRKATVEIKHEQLEQAPQPAVVHFFRAGVFFSIENAF